MKFWVIGLAALLILGASPTWAEEEDYGTVTVIRGGERNLIVYDVRRGERWITHIHSAGARPDWWLYHQGIVNRAKLPPGAVRTGKEAVKLASRGPEILRGGGRFHPSSLYFYTRFAY